MSSACWIGTGGRSRFGDWLIAKTAAPPARIGVAIETPHGPIVEMLLERGFAVFAINPKQLDRFRDRFTVAGAKDDRRDAHVLGDSLRTDRRAFRRLSVDDPTVIELREWSRIADDLSQERTRLANRIRQLLWRYYPQMLQLADDLTAENFLALWECAPTPARAAQIDEAGLAKVMKAHRVRRIGPAEALRILRQTPLRVAAGATEAAVAHIEFAAERVRLVNRQLKDAHQKLEALCARLERPTARRTGERAGQQSEQRDVTILRSLPGVGRTGLATLLVEATEPLRRRDYQVLRGLSGVAPVTRRSGKARLVTRRMACNERLREAVYHWARVAMQIDPESKRRYAALRQRGHSHGRALRTLGDRLLAMACAMLRSQTLYDPDRKAVSPAA
jgi:transposase